MKLKFPKYPSYKSSGIEWLGDVPSHWEVKRMRFMLTMNPSKREISKLPGDTEVSFFPMEAVGENGELSYDQTRAIDDVSSGYTFFGENDVAFAKITPCFENGKGAIMRNLVCGCGFGTTELTVLRCSDRLDPEFLFHVTKSNLFRQNGEAWMYGAGGQKRVPDEYVKNLRFSLPPLPEQKAIAAFLDRETERIDGLIGKREKLIALMQEKRAALISHAVTKGLNPSTKMKPSGIDWLGDIPAHWEVKRLKYNFSLKTERFVTDENPIALENIESWTGRFIPTNSEFEGDGMAFKQGDILFGKLRPYLAKVFLAERNGEAIGDLFVMAPRQTVCPKFAAYLFRTRDFIEIIDGSTFGSKMPRASWGFVGNMPFPLSPLSEQNAIATYLDAETKKIDGLMEREQQIIERMKEYRSALISAAVTGKIDVRGSV